MCNIQSAINFRTKPNQLNQEHCYPQCNKLQNTAQKQNPKTNKNHQTHKPIQTQKRIKLQSFLTLLLEIQYRNQNRKKFRQPKFIWFSPRFLGNQTVKVQHSQTKLQSKELQIMKKEKTENLIYHNILEIERFHNKSTTKINKSN